MISIILISVAILLFAWTLWGRRKSLSEPPGPMKFPLVGNLVQLSMADPQSHLAMQKLSKTYGDVMSLQMGFLPTIIVSSYEATKELFNRDETLGRLCEGVWWDRCLQQNIGLGFSNGQAWHDMRNFLKNTLKEYGFGNRGSMEQLIQAELPYLIESMDQQIEENEGRVHFSVHYFHLTFINIMAGMIMGTRHSYEDEDLQKLLKDSVDFVKNGIVGAGILTAFPFLRFVCPDALGYNVQMKAAQGIREYAKKFLDKRKERNYTTDPMCLTDDFLRNMDENPTNPIFTEDQFLVTFSDVMQGGSETSSNSVNYTLLLLTCHPEVQEKFYDEIVEICGEHKPSLDDKPKMIYTQAVILEGFRWGRTIVHGLPKKVTEDFMYRDYLIKKGSVLMQNTHTVFFDEEYWGDPHVFRPERFLDENGCLIASRAERISIAFGAGKRNCFGEVMARDSHFFFLSTLIQRYSFSLPPNEKQPTLDPFMGVTLGPYPYNAILERRPPLFMRRRSTLAALLTYLK